MICFLEGPEDDSIRIETCCPSTIINIIKFCCVWLIHHCIFIYVLNTSRWQTLKLKKQVKSLSLHNKHNQKPSKIRGHSRKAKTKHNDWILHWTSLSPANVTDRETSEVCSFHTPIIHLWDTTSGWWLRQLCPNSLLPTVSTNSLWDIQKCLPQGVHCKTLIIQPTGHKVTVLQLLQMFLSRC